MISKQCIQFWGFTPHSHFELFSNSDWMLNHKTFETDFVAFKAAIWRAFQGLSKKELETVNPAKYSGYLWGEKNPNLHGPV